jgi:enolase-phosphatase E1
MSTAPRLYLLDVEGTVAPIAFVYERLFPFARKHFRAFLSDMSDDAAVQDDLAMLLEENRADADAPRISAAAAGQPIEWQTFRDECLGYLRWLMDRDRKSTALKSLQGKIWRAGFESGELQGDLFPDVPDALRRWSKAARVAIYSSGSVEAQQLLFRHSNFGDLTPYIAGYFDTRTGAKKVGASYAAIAEAIGIAAQDGLFFSDVVRELDAAREAGFQTRLVMRQGNAAVEDAHGHVILGGLDGI